MRFRLVFLFLCLVLATIAPAGTVEEYIQSQSKIRIITDGAAGFGNQTASLNVITRLRQMGYKGAFEFIYPERAAYKIRTLFDLPDNIPDDYQSAKFNIRFIKIKEYVNLVHQNKIEPLTLGISGVFYNNFCDEAKNEGATPIWSSLSCENLATVMKTKKFINLSPFTSPPEERDWISKFDTEIFTKDKIKRDFQKNSDSKFIVMPVATLADAKNYLLHDNRGQELLAKKPGLNPLIKAIENQTVNVMPVYGYPIQKSGYCAPNDTPEDCKLTALTNILQIVLGAHLTQQNGTNDLKKPLIIPVFYDYIKEANELNKLITENWQPTKPEAIIAKKRIVESKLASQFLVANIDDPESVTKIQNLHHNQILLLSLGSLPKIVFDGLYTHTGANVWPQIREGANSFNSLLLTGKPHFRCGGEWEIGFHLIKNEELKTQFDSFYNYESSFCSNWSPWLNNGEIIDLFSQFLIAAQDENSAFSQYFVLLKQEALKPENDRIRFALEAVSE